MLLMQRPLNGLREQRMKMRDKAVMICPRDGTRDVKEGESGFRRVYLLASQPCISDAQSAHHHVLLKLKHFTRIEPELYRLF